MSDEDRPKKSWREIDASRDRSGGSAGKSSKDREEGRRERATAKSPAYRQYKSQLDKLFTPGGTELPESLRSKLGPVDAQAKRAQELVKTLRENQDEAALRAIVSEGLELPDDPRLLTGLLDVSDEDELLLPLLQALLALVESGKKPNRMLLIQKLDALRLRLGSGEAVELASQVRAALD